MACCPNKNGNTGLSLVSLQHLERGPILCQHLGALPPDSTAGKVLQPSSLSQHVPLRLPALQGRFLRHRPQCLRQGHRERDSPPWTERTEINSSLTPPPPCKPASFLEGGLGQQSCLSNESVNFLGTGSV